MMMVIFIFNIRVLTNNIIQLHVEAPTFLLKMAKYVN